MEKRNRPRVVFDSQADIAYNGNTISCEIENLSMEGMFLQTNEKIPEKTEVNASIQLSGSTTNLCIDLKGTVVRCEKNGIAIKFNEIELDSFIHLRNVVSYAGKDLHEFDELP
jgi:hypothetical protein